MVGVLVTLATNQSKGNILHGFLKREKRSHFLLHTTLDIYFEQDVILSLWCSHYWYVDHSYTTALIKSDKSRSD